MTRGARFSLFGLLLLSIPAHAQAGMPAPITFTELARMRLEVISFFIVGYLVMAWLVKLLWNSLAGAFETMPRLNYRRALSLSLVSGLFLYVVLTMISGARELMTPGAWERDGRIYRLAADGEPAAKARDLTLSERERALRNLKDALWTYAEAHEGALPLRLHQEEIAEGVRRHPGDVQGYYGYRPGAHAGEGERLVAYEGVAFGGERLALLSSGEVVSLDSDELRLAIEETW